jgi:plastocyanin
MAARPTRPCRARGPLTAAAALLLALTSGCSGSQGPAEPAAERSPETSSTAPDAPTSSAAPDGGSGAPAEQVVLRISDFAFSVPPSVPAGAEVTVVNEDNSFHTVTAKDGAFDVQAPSGTVTFTAPEEPGDYPFFCTVHPSMTGTLVVT